MEELAVIKIGGETLDDQAALDRVLAAVASSGKRIVLVHGGGRQVTELAGRLGIPQVMIEGRRITSAETLSLCVMVYAGLISKSVVAGLSAYGRKAIGMSGADMDCIRSVRRSATPIDFGYVGDVSAVDADVFDGMISQGVIPVVCSVSLGTSHELLNVNADVMAAAIAKAMAGRYAVSLAYCFAHPGVMADMHDPGSLIPSIAADELDRLREAGVISGGMIPKVGMALDAAREGLKEVRILHGDNLSDFLAGRPVGTHIHARS